MSTASDCDVFRSGATPERPSPARLRLAGRPLSRSVASRARALRRRGGRLRDGDRAGVEGERERRRVEVARRDDAAAREHERVLAGAVQRRGDGGREQVERPAQRPVDVARAAEAERVLQPPRPGPSRSEPPRSSSRRPAASHSWPGAGWAPATFASIGARRRAEALHRERRSDAEASRAGRRPSRARARRRRPRRRWSCTAPGRRPGRAGPARPRPGAARRPRPGARRRGRPPPRPSPRGRRGRAGTGRRSRSTRCGARPGARRRSAWRRASRRRPAMRRCRRRRARSGVPACAARTASAGSGSPTAAARPRTIRADCSAARSGATASPTRAPRPVVSP